MHITNLLLRALRSTGCIQAANVPPQRSRRRCTMLNVQTELTHSHGRRPVQAVRAHSDGAGQPAPQYGKRAPAPGALRCVPPSAGGAATGCGRLTHRPLRPRFGHPVRCGAPLEVCAALSSRLWYCPSKQPLQHRLTFPCSSFSCWLHSLNTGQGGLQSEILLCIASMN